MCVCVCVCVFVCVCVQVCMCMSTVIMLKCVLKVVVQGWIASNAICTEAHTLTEYCNTQPKCSSVQYYS